MSNNKSDSENDDISGPRPRLCHLRKWSHFQGYGFNLHAEKTRNGQSIGKVDPNSPAESAGLKEKDRIIEVNFVNISNENHQQVVKRIRCGLEVNGQINENEVVLLVVDPEADEYYKKRNIVVKHDFKNVLKLETPPEDAHLNNNTSNNKVLPPESSPHVSSHRNSVSSTSEHNNSTEINNNNFDKVSNDYRPYTNTSQNNEKVSTSLAHDKSYERVSPPQTPLSTKSNGSVSSSSINKDTQSNKSSTNTMNNNNNHHGSTSSNNNNNNANPFNMSAAEYKAFLKTNKQKSDPRNVHVDIKQKYQIFQNM